MRGTGTVVVAAVSVPADDSVPTIVVDRGADSVASVDATSDASPRSFRDVGSTAPTIAATIRMRAPANAICHGRDQVADHRQKRRSAPITRKQLRLRRGRARVGTRAGRDAGARPRLLELLRNSQRKPPTVS